MNVPLKFWLYLFVLAFVWVACSNETDDLPATNDGEYFETELEPPVRPDKPAVSNPELISEAGVLGVVPGADVAKYGEVLEKGVIENGEGRFEVYHVTDAAGQRVGYTLPGRKSPNKVGDIVVTSPEFFDGSGIRIGSTWDNLKTAYPDIVAYGSEVEARVYAVNGKISYRLDHANSAYEFDNGEISPTAKITEIVVEQ